MVDQLSKTAAGSETPEFLQAMFAPMQQQFDLLQQGFEKQAEFQRELTERALGSMKQMLNEMQKAAETARAAGEACDRLGGACSIGARQGFGLWCGSPVPRLDAVEPGPKRGCRNA
jgi:hypothetical protein